MSTELLAKLEALILPVLSGYGLELADLELKGEGRRQILRIFIDKPGGVTLDDCADVSREIGTLTALGASGGVIRGLFLLESASFGLVAAGKIQHSLVVVALYYLDLDQRSFFGSARTP